MKDAHANLRIRRVLLAIGVILLLGNLCAAATAVKNHWFITATPLTYVGIIYDTFSIWIGRIVTVGGGLFALSRRWMPGYVKSVSNYACKNFRDIVTHIVFGTRSLVVSIVFLIVLFGLLIRASMQFPPFLPPGASLVLMPTGESSSQKLQYMPNLYLALPEQNKIEVYNRDRIKLPEETIMIGNPLVPGTPTCLAVAPKRRELYATDTTSNELLIIDRLRHITRIPVGYNPRWVSITPDERKAYVSNEQPVPEGKITIVDLKERRVAGEITNVNCPQALALSPDGHRLYVATQCGAHQDPLLVIDTARDKVIATVRGFGVGLMAAVSPKGDIVYVSMARPDSKSPDHILVVSTRDNRILSKVPINGHITTALTVTPDGEYLLVGVDLGIKILKTTSMVEVNTVHVGASPLSIAVTPRYGTYVLYLHGNGKDRDVFLFGLRGLVEEKSSAARP